MIAVIDPKAVEQQDVDALLKQLESDRQGLSKNEAQARLQQFGPNALEEKRISPLRRFLGYFWGPIPWMIEVAAILSALVCHWVDFFIIVALLIFNAGIGFWQEYKAANALDALKKQLALKARALRDGQWDEIDAKDLVPGDVIRLRLGDIIPADVKLLEGDYLSVDQSSLTGESLPVNKQAGDVAYSGSVVKQGEMLALVTGTGSNTFFGRTAKLVESAGSVSHFQKAVLTIGDYLIYVSLGLVTLLILVLLFRHADWIEVVQFALILTVASIPVAMPAVLSGTMAIGALALSKMKAIVSRLQSIEEMAGIDVLCSDKTGTLTENKLTLGETAVFEAESAAVVVLVASLASKEEDGDAIDLAVLSGLPDKTVLADFSQLHFTPFDPVSKRTEATIRSKDGEIFKVSKGAPQVILELCHLEQDKVDRANTLINEFASKGYRTLGVARTDTSGVWRFLGILPLFDPPRKDSAETLQKASEHGIEVKMITGDNVAIAREIAAQLKLGTDIQPVGDLFPEAAVQGHLSSKAVERIETVDGFAQVFPEHKYAIVKALQERGHLVAMTGDGVNDAPALKQADVGIAVSGATDVARAAADLILTAPGLSTIVSAIEEARRIFERMNAYAIYRIAETIRIMVFVVLAMILFNFYPITAIMIILLAFFNDVPILMIAYDRTGVSQRPVRWNMREVITVGTSLGVFGVLGSFGMLLIAMEWLKLDVAHIQTYVFLKMAVSGHLLLFLTRTKDHFWKRPWPAPILIWSAVITKLFATLVAAYGFGLITPISWPEIALIWGYSVVSTFLADLVKVMVYRNMRQQTLRHRHFLDTISSFLHTHRC